MGELPPGWPYTARPEGGVSERDWGDRPWTLSRGSGTTPSGKPARRVHWESRRDRFEQMWREDVEVEEMADFFEVSTGTIYSKASQWKLGRRRPLHGPRKKCRGRKPSPHRTSNLTDRSGQRRFKSARHTEITGPHVRMEPHDPRLVAGITIFPTTVFPASKLPRLLKSGHNSRKIGKQVTKGRWKGFPIFTLTLQERATCPRTCKEWATCYGNNMPFAHRIFDDGTLTRRLWGELAALNAQHPDGFVVRLHILGDFYSLDYVSFWADSLHDFPALRVFGFTARRPPDPIGVELVHLVLQYRDRFVMRFSGAGLDRDGAEVVDKAEDAVGILCPAQRDENRCCATCALCWQSDHTISFKRH